MIIRSIFSNWVGLAVTGVISIFLTPFMIHRLGNFEYGMWVLVGSLLDYYGLLDLGMRTAVFRFVSQFKGSGERDALDVPKTRCVLATLRNCEKPTVRFGFGAPQAKRREQRRGRTERAR